MADPFYAFLDNLVRAATGTRHVAVVLSLPKSAVEMTQYEQDWQDRITKIVKRVARDLIANDESEVSEVVRRRLFEDLGPERNSAQVAKTYADWCFERRAELPPQWTAVDPTLTERRAREVLRDRFAACYPFHPATLSVFQRKWQSLPQYQQTRGTLGMLAQWLSRLYASHHQQAQAEPLITLGSAPLEDRSFRATILGQLGEPRLTTTIEADLAADTAHARALDADTKGPLQGIHRQVGTAILFECSGSQTDRAAHLPELRFALGGPQVDTTSIDTAAAALESRAFFVRQVGSDGYRIGTKPKLSKVVAEKRASLDEFRDVLPEARRLIEREFEAGSPVPVIAFPGDGGDVRDTPRLSLLIVRPDTPWDGTDEMRAYYAEWTYRRGRESRLFPASLIWCLRQPGRCCWTALKPHSRGARSARISPRACWASTPTRRRRAASTPISGPPSRTRGRRSGPIIATWSSPTARNRARMRVIDLGAGHSSSRESLAGRALAALKSQGLLNDRSAPAISTGNGRRRCCKPEPGRCPAYARASWMDR